VQVEGLYAQIQRERDAAKIMADQQRMQQQAAMRQQQVQ
jgi:hypothetical protein